MLDLPPLSLYIHMPWCLRKCPYCDFNSHERRGDIPQARYIDTLCKDLQVELQRIGGRPLISIFIGGGTPSLFDAPAYARLLGFIRDNFILADDIEITLEANPGSAEAGRFTAYRDLGINRLSLGIQSFDDMQLQRLGRVHDAMEARSAIVLARQAGFHNLNLDLMHGLPGQSVVEALRDLQIAIDQQAAHLSWYQLTIEPNTLFYRRPPTLPRDPVLEEIHDMGQQLLANFGYAQYEVSAFAKPAHASRHNTNYWSFGDYIGVGAGAHGKLTAPDENRLIRTRKLKQPDHYLDASGDWVAEQVDVPLDHRALEYLMNALRLRGGFREDQFEAGTGLAFSTIVEQVSCQVDRGLLLVEEQEDGRVYAASERGYRVLNSVLEEFF